MAAARRDADWDHTSLLASILINANKTKGNPVKPEDIHPNRNRGGGESQGVSLRTEKGREALKQLAKNFKHISR